MSGPANLNAEKIALRFLAAAQSGAAHEEEIIAGCVDGVPVEQVEVALKGLGLPSHRERMKLHYRAPGEPPKLVLDRK